MFNIFLASLSLLVLLYVGLSVLYLLVLALAGKFFYRNSYAAAGNAAVEAKRIALLVPAYKEDGIILSTAANLLALDYPSSCFDVYVIADSFAKETVQQLRQLPLQVLEVQFETSTKTKSLNEAFGRITADYDIALVCDADNMLEKDFLTKINHAFAKGARAVQARRVAKNMDTSFAMLDACSEAINNHLFRKGASALGLSSSVIGSGMAFDFALLRQVLLHIEAVGGFDKVLQLNLVSQNIPIVYLEHALVFDEKVSSSGAFRQQRKRWLASQFTYLKKYLPAGIRFLLKGNASYFNLAVLNNLVLPRVFLLAFIPLWILLTCFIAPGLVLPALVLYGVYLFSLAIALPAELVNRKLLQALFTLPQAVIGMSASLLKMKNANKRFIHTVHTQTEISNPIFNNHGQ